jgi:Protein DA1
MSSNWWKIKQNISLSFLSFYPGFRSLSPEVEEGICQVMAHLWLESEITSGSISTTITHTASTSASTSSLSTSSKKGPKSDSEKKLGEFFKNQIETDTSAAYGDGFRLGMKAVDKYGLRTTLDHIKLTGSFPY